MTKVLKIARVNSRCILKVLNYILCNIMIYDIPGKNMSRKLGTPGLQGTKLIGAGPKFGSNMINF